MVNCEDGDRVTQVTASISKVFECMKGSELAPEMNGLGVEERIYLYLLAVALRTLQRHIIFSFSQIGPRDETCAFRLRHSPSHCLLKGQRYDSTATSHDTGAASHLTPTPVCCISFRTFSTRSPVIIDEKLTRFNRGQWTSETCYLAVAISSLDFRTRCSWNGGLKLKCFIEMRLLLLLVKIRSGIGNDRIASCQSKPGLKSTENSGTSDDATGNCNFTFRSPKRG